MQINMLALEINTNTYSLAVASLPPVFATIPHPEVIGRILVLNQVDVRYGRKSKVQTLTIGNAWMEPEEFHKTFEFTDSSIDWTRDPAPITRISR